MTTWTCRGCGTHNTGDRCEQCGLERGQRYSLGVVVASLVVVGWVVYSLIRNGW